MIASLRGGINVPGMGTFIYFTWLLHGHITAAGGGGSYAWRVKSVLGCYILLIDFYAGTVAILAMQHRKKVMHQECKGKHKRFIGN